MKTKSKSKSRSILCVGILFMLVLITSCGSATSVPFIEAENYYFRNDAPLPASPKITSREAFESYFGMAAVMGDDGMPTAIDFERQFVIAVVLPETDIDTDIDPEEVELRGNTLRYTYKVETGERETYTSQPFAIIILDKKYQDASVELLPIKEAD